MTPVINLRRPITSNFWAAVLMVCIAFCFSNSLHVQNQYTTILKNNNPEAQNLYHELSPQGDTLYLKAESIFYKVTFLNSLDRKVYTFNPPRLEGKIPLHEIIVGDYAVLVYKKDRIIVFHISRLEEITTPYEIIASKQLSIIPYVSIVKPVIPFISSKEKLVSEHRVNNIKIDDTFKLSIAELKVAINDENFSVNEPNLSSMTRPYNLCSMDRTNMQSRKEYRRNNLRPNGKPYF